MNPLIDHHMHTYFSLDADPNAMMETYLVEVKKRGVTGVMFTDHVDFDNPSVIFENPIDYDRYYAIIQELRKNESLFIGMGVEIGYQPHIESIMKSLLNRYPFDFVICSIHFGDRLDFYNGDFFKHKTQDEAYARYFQLVLDAVQSYDEYDVFGHLDYIIRYGQFETKMYDFDRYQPIIDQILRVIIDKKKGIELNTSGLRYGLGVTHPRLEVLKRYKALGGTIITLGSDAHRVSDYYQHFDLAISLLKEAGFDQITIFKNRKPSWVNI